MVTVMVTPDEVPYKHITKVTGTIHLLSFNYILYWSQYTGHSGICGGEGGGEGEGKGEREGRCSEMHD